MSDDAPTIRRSTCCDTRVIYLNSCWVCNGCGERCEIEIVSPNPGPLERAGRYLDGVWRAARDLLAVGGGS